MNTKLKFFFLSILKRMEIVNRSLGNLLCCPIGDHVTTWYQILPMAKFTYNSSVNISIGCNLFEIVTDMLSKKPIDLVPLPLKATPSVEANVYSTHI